MKRIEAADGTRKEYFIASAPEPGLRLHVLLRAHESKQAEEVIIDLSAGTITFQRAEKVHVCTQCRQFASAYSHLVTNEHHRRAHGGIGPTFRVKNTATLQQTAPLQFTFQPPQNPWV